MREVVIAGAARTPMGALQGVLAGCNATSPHHPSGPMASGRDRTFSVPVYGTDTSPAYAAATRECQRLALFPKLLRNDGSRLIFECVSEAPDRQP